MTKIMSPEELEQELRAIGAERYHDKHPFHKLLHGGKLNKGQVQAWALNRYCYQSAVPRKDAALMSRCHDRQLRRDWIHRIMDHDGYGEEEGGIERWLVLTDGLGLDRDYVVSMKGALPETRVRGRGLCQFRAGEDPGRGGRLLAHRAVRAQDSQGAHLGHARELRFHQRRGDGLFQAPPDAGAGRCRNSRSTTSSATRARPRRRPPRSMRCDSNATCLWAQLDALHYAYVEPGLVPPGAFVPGKS